MSCTIGVVRRSASRPRVGRPALSKNTQIKSDVTRRMQYIAGSSVLDTTILRVVPRVNAAVIACHPHPVVHRVVQAAGRIGTTIPEWWVVAGRPLQLGAPLLQHQSKGAPGRRQSKLCSDHRSTAACIGEARPPRWQALAWTARARQLPVAHEVGCRRPRSPRVGVGRDPNREAPQCPRCGICVRNASSPRGDLRQGRRRGRRGAR
jgi:hypothetical protein